MVNEQSVFEPLGFDCIGLGKVTGLSESLVFAYDTVYVFLCTGEYSTPCFHTILQKHAYSNTLKILPPKKGNFSDKKKSDIFYMSAQNIDCGYSLEPPRREGSNEYPQSMFLSRNKKNNVYPCKPQFYYIKVGFKGVKIT